MNTSTAKVRVGSEVSDLDFMLDEVQHGDLVLALAFVPFECKAWNAIEVAIKAIRVARDAIVSDPRANVDRRAVRNAADENEYNRELKLRIRSIGSNGVLPATSNP
jgi:hypothetical protein